MPYRSSRWSPAVSAGAVAVLLLLTACASVEASQPEGPTPSRERTARLTPTPSPSTEQPRTVRLTVTGGVAGVHRSILASTDGSVKVGARQNGDTDADPLSGADRDRLETLLDGVDFAALPPRSIDEGARDMFLYTLEHDGRSVVTDRSVSLGLADDLIGQLERHLEERL